jgi:hypothetical protein
MKIIENENEFQEFISIDKPTIIVFATHDCATCKPVEKKIDDRFKDINKAKVYLGDMPTLKGSLGVFNVPVVCIYFEGKEFTRFIRVFGIDEIEEKLDRLRKFI